jgi:site-specific DNA-methyltransferase (adenine-specific)
LSLLFPIYNEDLTSFFSTILSKPLDKRLSGLTCHQCADKGVDGIVYFQGDKNEPEKVIFQVKSGKVKSGDIRVLLGTMTLENASIAIFITLENPTKEMLKTAKSAGFYQSKYYSNYSCDKIQIVTVKDIIENKQKLNIPLSYEVVKSAEKQKEVGVQIKMDLDI